MAGARAVANKTAPRLRRNSKRLLQALAQTPLQSALDRITSASSSLRVLGLDINTNSTGYAVLDNHGRVCRWGHISTARQRSTDVLAVAHRITQELQCIAQDVAMEATPASTPTPPSAPMPMPSAALQWRVGIEDFMRMYRFGQYHNQGIFQLAQLNGMVSYTCWRQFQTRPLHTHPSAARGFFGIVAAPRKKSATTVTVKDQVMQFVRQRCADQQEDALRMAQLEALRMKRSQQWSEEAFDLADAYVIAAHTRWMHLQGLLSSDADVLAAFRDAYLSLLMTDESSKRKTVEETAVRAMTDAEKETYLMELLADGIADWSKLQQQHDITSKSIR